MSRRTGHFEILRRPGVREHRARHLGPETRDGEPSPLDVPVRAESTGHLSLIELEIANRQPARHEPSAGDETPAPPNLEQVVGDAARRRSGARFRRRWLAFGVVAGAALWLGGTLWSSKDGLVGDLVPAPSTSDRQLDPEAEALDGGSEGEAVELTHATADHGVGRLAVAPSWHPDITVAVNGQAPVTLDSRRMFEVEAEREHVLTFELATRDYQIREQVTTRVGRGRLLEVPVPLQRPGAISVLHANEDESPVFVRVGDEAIGWTPIREFVAPAGQHTLSLLRNPTWKPDERYDQKIRVESRKQTTVHIDFVSKPPSLLVGDARHELVLRNTANGSSPVQMAAGPTSND